MKTNPMNLAEAEHDSARATVLHWYDFLCPLCYVGQQRNTIFESHGFEVADLPFQAHPDIPPGGRVVGERTPYGSNDSPGARAGAERFRGRGPVHRTPGKPFRGFSFSPR